MVLDRQRVLNTDAPAQRLLYQILPVAIHLLSLLNLAKLLTLLLRVETLRTRRRCIFFLLLALMSLVLVKLEHGCSLL